MSEEIKWCPTLHGTYTAYKPQYLVGEQWRDVPLVHDKCGLPQPSMFGGINDAVSLCGYAQSQALAWGFAAISAADGVTVEVRSQPYEVVFDIKARELSDTPPASAESEVAP